MLFLSCLWVGSRKTLEVDVRRDGTEIFFWRTRTQHEVDFLEAQNGKVAAFECKSSPKTKTTSIRAFERAYPDTPVTIATPGNVDELFA